MSYKNGKKTVTERIRNGLILLAQARSKPLDPIMVQELGGHPVTGEMDDKSIFRWVGGPGPELEQVNSYFVTLDTTFSILGEEEDAFPYLANMGVWTLPDGSKIIQSLIIPKGTQWINTRVGIWTFMGIFEDALLVESFGKAFVMAQAYAHAWGKVVNRWESATTKTAVESLDLYDYRTDRMTL